MNFEFGLNVVNPRERQIIGERAMAGDVKASANFLDLDVVHVDNLRKLHGERFQTALEGGVAYRLVARFDGGGFTFDVGEDVPDLPYIVAHVGFEFGHLIVGVLQCHALVQFNMLLDMEFAREILHADVVDVQVVAGSDGANTVEDIFRTLGARQGLNGDVGVGKNLAHSGGNCFH